MIIAPQVQKICSVLYDQCHENGDLGPYIGNINN